MTRPRVVLLLWLVCAFVVWNVVFDRYVAIAAIEFTRDQVLRYDRGDTLTTIHDGFSPQVRGAALAASLWVTPIVAAGAAAFYYTRRRAR